MHGGIWSLCVDLIESELRELTRNGMPPALQCINYLAESSEYSKHDDLKFDQHGDYQVTKRPSLSKLPAIYSSQKCSKLIKLLVSLF